MFTENRSQFFLDADFASACTWDPLAGGSRRHALVIKDEPDDQVDASLSREHEIRFESAVLSGLKRGETVRIKDNSGAWADYNVREVTAESDGAISTARLSRI